MKILFLANYYFPHIGGVEKHLEKLSANLIKKGHTVSLITQLVETSKVEENRKGVKIYRHNPVHIKFIGLIYIWFWMFKNRKLIEDADLVHAHDVGIWYWPFRVFYFKKPFYMTFHGYEGYPVSFKSRFIRKISEKISLGNICIGDFMKKWYGTVPTIVSYGAVDRKKYKPDNKEKYPYDAVFLSRLDEQTGILTYIKAVKRLKDFKLLVLGDGKYRKEAEKNAEVEGFVKDTSKYFDKARFAFVSRYLAILEAFAAKKLVFAVYDTPIKKDYLTMAPFGKWIVVQKNSKKLAEKINYYRLHKNKAEERINKAYNWVKDMTWDKMADNYLDLWTTK